MNQRSHLIPEKIWRTIVEKDEVSQLDFLRQRQLPQDSLPGELRGKPTLLKPCKLYSVIRRDAYR